MIIFALSQGDRGFHERDQRIFFGPDFLTIHELKHKLHEFFDLYETDNRSLEVRIVYMEGDGDTTVQVCLLAHKVQIDLSREQTEEEKKIFVPFEDYPKIYPESAFDENGNISYWRYGSKVDYSVNRRVGSHGTRLEGRKSYIDDGKDKFIDDIVRYTFTWLEQEDKTWSPLSPHGTQTLREIPEPSAK